MKIKRAPLLGAISIILILFLITIGTSIYFNKKYNEQKTTNELLNTTLVEQAVAIDNLNTEKAELIAKISELEKKVDTNQTQHSTRSKTVTSPQTNNASNLGQFKITAYCNCSQCCGKWSGGPTASGTIPTAGRTIAVDPNVIPLGSKVTIDGHTYIAEDTGSAIKGNKIDMFFSSHQEALNWGVKYKDVNIVG